MFPGLIIAYKVLDLPSQIFAQSDLIEEIFFFAFLQSQHILSQCIG